MHPAITSYLAEPDLAKVDPEGDLARCFVLLDRAAVHSRDARELQRAFAWIAGQPNRSFAEKFWAMDKLIMFRPGTHVLIPSMKKFCGWDEHDRGGGKTECDAAEAPEGAKV